MSDDVFPATSRDHFPSTLHEWLEAAELGNFTFPQPEDMIAPPLTEMNSVQERMVKFAYFNYWLAALRVYYINAAWAYSYGLIETPHVAGDAYVEQCRKINDAYVKVEQELYIHYGYDYPGPIAL